MSTLLLSHAGGGCVGENSTTTMGQYSLLNYLLIQDREDRQATRLRGSEKTKSSEQVA